MVDFRYGPAGGGGGGMSGSLSHVVVEWWQQFHSSGGRRAMTFVKSSDKRRERYGTMPCYGVISSQLRGVVYRAPTRRRKKYSRAKKCRASYRVARSFKMTIGPDEKVVSLLGRLTLFVRINEPPT
jgi:hypothetical protein